MPNFFKNFFYFSFFILLFPGCRHISADSSEKATLKDYSSDDRTSGDTYEWQYGHHRIHAFVFKAGGWNIDVSTTINDQEEDGRNTSFGGRPTIIYHKVSLVHEGDKEIYFSKWPDEPAENDYTDIYCRSINQIKEFEKWSYPADLVSFANEFNIKKSPDISSCPIKVKKPVSRPNTYNPQYPIYSPDMICIFSPKEAADKGPKFIGIYIPFKYYPEGFTHPNDMTSGKIHDWPELTGVEMCIDGKVFDLKGEEPPKID